jgi:uncharacterized protein (TIGR03435 family)
MKKEMFLAGAAVCAVLVIMGWLLSNRYSDGHRRGQGAGEVESVGLERRAEIGHPAPEFGLEKVLQAPAGAEVTWASLRGKVVVLDFWGTWCGACVMTIPHMNKLAEEFRGKDVVFIAVTYEDETAVKAFLTKRPIGGWIGLDTDRSMVRAYRVQGWPHGVIVNKDGVIAGIMHPGLLTAEMLKEVLATGKLKTQPTSDDLPAFSKEAQEADPSVSAFFMMPGVDRRGEKPPLFRVVIREPEFTNNSGLVHSSSGRLTGRNVGLDAVMSAVFGVSRARIVIGSSLSESKYDVVINMPREQEGLMEASFEQALEATFGLRVRREKRESPVYVMSLGRSGVRGLKESEVTGGMEYKAGKVSMTAQPIGTLCRYIEDYLKKAVVDETDLGGRYDVELEWDAGRPDSIIGAVRERLGLELKEEVRGIEMVVVGDEPEKK